MASLENPIKFEEELRPILYTLVQKTEVEESLPNSLYEVSMTLIPKLTVQKEKVKKTPDHS